MSYRALKKKRQEFPAVFIHPNKYKYIISLVNCQYFFVCFKQNLPIEQNLIVNFAHLVN